MENNLIIINGRCLTMDENKEADWIATEDGKIAAIGRGDGYKAFLHENTQLVDAKGRTVLPGFIDNHFHLVKGAIFSSFINVSEARNFDEIGEILREGRKKSGEDYSPEYPLMAFGVEPEKLKEGRYPNREDLDRFISDVPMVLYTPDYHIMMLNTCAILTFQIPYMLQGVSMDEKGIPDGIFSKLAAARLEEHILKKYQQKAIIKKINDFVPDILSNGITTVTAMEGSNYITGFEKEREAELVLKIAGDIPLSTELFYQTTDVNLVKEKGLKRFGGALYLDGTLGSWTAVNSFPYADKKEQKPGLFIKQEYIDKLVEKSCENELQLSFDAIGDMAVEAAISAFEKCKERFDVKKLRPRIEHCELIRDDQMERAAELGIIVSAQPGYEGKWGGEGGMYAERLGENYKKTNPFREMKDRGIVLCGGSDYNINPLNPMVGVYHAMNHPVKEHSLTLEEALRMYTIDGAFALGMEKERGSLTPGKKGDIVILNDSTAAMTIREGEIMYDGTKDA